MSYTGAIGIKVLSWSAGRAGRPLSACWFRRGHRWLFASLLDALKTRQVRRDDSCWRSRRGMPSTYRFEGRAAMGRLLAGTAGLTT